LARAMRRSHVITVRGYAKGLFERASKMIRTQIDEAGHNRFVYSAGIGVAGAVGELATCDGTDGPLSGRSSIAIRNAMPNESTRAQARNTKRKA
jgi:hypothetical protein